MAPKSRTLYESRTGFAAELNGKTIVVRKGTRVAEGHELLRKFAARFRPITVDYTVEDTTAEPGRPRSSVA